MDIVSIICKRTLLTITALLFATPIFATDYCVAVERADDDGKVTPLDSNLGSCYGWFGKWQGIWELRFADGQVETGTYVNDKQHGLWKQRDPDGRVDVGPVVNGKRHGLWVLRLANGVVETGQFVDGKRHGWWKFEGNIVGGGRYVSGKRHGRWEAQLPDGTVKILNFVNGTLQ